MEDHFYFRKDGPRDTLNHPALAGSGGDFRRHQWDREGPSRRSRRGAEGNPSGRVAGFEVFSGVSSYPSLLRIPLYPRFPSWEGPVRKAPVRIRIVYVRPRFARAHAAGGGPGPSPISEDKYPCLEESDRGSRLVDASRHRRGDALPRAPGRSHPGGRPGRGRLEVVVRTEHLRDVGILHGGMSATLLDSVMGMSAASVAPPGYYVVTVQLNMNFIRPAWEGEHLVATGEVTHSGRQTAVARAEIRTADGILVSSGSATFLFVPHEAPRWRRRPTRRGARAGPPPRTVGPMSSGINYSISQYHIKI